VFIEAKEDSSFSELTRLPLPATSHAFAEGSRLGWPLISGSGCLMVSGATKQDNNTRYGITRIVDAVES
jgi:hypothetical protein